MFSSLDISVEDCDPVAMSSSSRSSDHLYNPSSAASMASSVLPLQVLINKLHESISYQKYLIISLHMEAFEPK